MAYHENTEEDPDGSWCSLMGQQPEDHFTACKPIPCVMYQKMCGHVRERNL